MKKPLLYSLPPAGQKIPLKALSRSLARNWHHTYDRPIEAIKKYLGTDHVLYLSSGRAALWLFLKTVSSMKPDRKEVIVPAYTCPSVVSAVLKAGLTPILCDNNMYDFGFQTEEFENILSRKTLAVVVVHLYGVPVQIGKIQELCRDNETWLVEDAAQAFGNTFRDEENVKLGLKGDAGFYSFGRGKPISIMHGGLLVTKSEDVFKEAEKIFRGLNGDTKYKKMYYSLMLGAYVLFSNPHLYWIPQLVPFFNLGETIFEPEFDTVKGIDLAAAMASVMLSNLEKEKEVRKSNSKWFSDNLTQGYINHGAMLGEYPYLRYPLVIDDEDLRKRILEKLIARGTGATGSYPTPLNELPKLREVLADDKQYWNAKKISQSIVTLPVHSRVFVADKENINKIIRQKSHAN
jgi:perosamine synthetase